MDANISIIVIASSIGIKWTSNSKIKCSSSLSSHIFQMLVEFILIPFVDVMHSLVGVKGVVWVK